MTTDRSHLSEVQDLCTGNDVELVLGETYGLREWSIYSSDDLGLLSFGGSLPQDFRLLGHFGNEWDPTQPLVGTCQSDGTQLMTVIEVDNNLDVELVEFTVRKEMSNILQNLTDTLPIADPRTVRAYVQMGRITRSVDWMLDDPFSDRHRLQVPSDFMEFLGGVGFADIQLRVVGKPLPHPVGHPLCTCGIYAYHDRRSLSLSRVSGSRGFVLGLVRAYGHVTIGTKGLRAEKAQAVALTLPQECTALSDRVIAPVLAEWKAAGITILPTPRDLLDFAERGGYLENPDDLQKEVKS